MDYSALTVMEMGHLVRASADKKGSKNKMKKLFVLSLVFFLAGCTDSEERYSAGHGDGYAVGYNTACKIRATMIEGAWDSADYSRGYADGVTEGITACQNM